VNGEKPPENTPFLIKNPLPYRVGYGEKVIRLSPPSRQYVL